MEKLQRAMHVLLQKSLFFFAMSTSVVFAGAGSGKITNINVHERGDGLGVIMFSVENNSHKAACSTAGGGKEWAFRVDNDQGKAMYSLLLSAATTGSEVYVDGKNDCNDWGDRERPKYISVQYVK